MIQTFKTYTSSSGGGPTGQWNAYSRNTDISPNTVNKLDERWFYYGLNQLFKRASLQTTYMSKNIASKEGRDLIDNFAMSDDDRDVFNINLKVVSTEVYDVILKMTHNIEDALVIQLTDDADTTTERLASAGTNPIYVEVPKGLKAGLRIKIQDNMNYNPNTINLVDISIEECLILGVCREWYQFVAHADFMNLFNTRYIEAQEKLKQRFFQLKKKDALS